MQTTFDFATANASKPAALGIQATATARQPTPKTAAATNSGIGKSHFIGNWEVRSFHGFHQSREGGKGKWKFQISSFNKSTANLLLIDGDATEPVYIDDNDRIKVLGKWYGRSNWNH
jgi:hypothetical protein